jgi:hypothetical protein
VTSRLTVGDACAVLDHLLLVLVTLRAAGRRRSDLVLENLLMRHQLAVGVAPWVWSPERLGSV